MLWFWVGVFNGEIFDVVVYVFFNWGIIFVVIDGVFFGVVIVVVEVYFFVWLFVDGVVVEIMGRIIGNFVD